MLTGQKHGTDGANNALHCCTTRLPASACRLCYITRRLLHCAYLLPTLQQRWRFEYISFIAGQVLVWLCCASTTHAPTCGATTRLFILSPKSGEELAQLSPLCVAAVSDAFARTACCSPDNLLPSGILNLYLQTLCLAHTCAQENKMLFDSGETWRQQKQPPAAHCWRSSWRLRAL